MGLPVQRRGRFARGIRKRRAAIGFIFQQFNLVHRLTLITNVLTGLLAQMPLHRRLLGWFTRREKSAAMAALAAVDMSEYASQRAGTLSGGQQQRGAIARAIVQGAKVILADEPIASLDPESARLVMEGLRRMNHDRNATIVVSVHQIEYARRYCDRVIALKDGQIVHDAAASSLEENTLRGIFGTEYARRRGGDDRRATEPPELHKPSTAASQLDGEARAGA
jgi:phosphonate transport system ATP-binding protein